MTTEQRRRVDRAVRWAHLARTLSDAKDRETVCAVARELVDSMSEHR